VSWNESFRDLFENKFDAVASVDASVEIYFTGVCVLAVCYAVTFLVHARLTSVDEWTSLLARVTRCCCGCCLPPRDGNNNNNINNDNSNDNSNSNSGSGSDNRANYSFGAAPLRSDVDADVIVDFNLMPAPSSYSSGEWNTNTPPAPSAPATEIQVTATATAKGKEVTSYSGFVDADNSRPPPYNDDDDDDAHYNGGDIGDMSYFNNSGNDDKSYYKAHGGGGGGGDEARTCVICLSAPPTWIILPCAHMSLCGSCAPPLIVKKGKKTSYKLKHCPQCRALVKEIKQTF
jgi:hypothetical protein